MSSQGIFCDLNQSKRKHFVFSLPFIKFHQIPENVMIDENLSKQIATPFFTT
jgi:hypothetical protein